MTFKEWLYDDAEIPRFAIWANDGTITFYIKGVKYSYLTNTIHYRRWKNMIRNCPPEAVKINSWLVVKEIEKTGTRLI